MNRYIQKNITNVFAVYDSNHKIDEYLAERGDCIVCNLGYLPSSDKKVATNAKTTIESIKKGLSLLKPGDYHVHRHIYRASGRIFRKIGAFRVQKNNSKPGILRDGAQFS